MSFQTLMNLSSVAGLVVLFWILISPKKKKEEVNHEDESPSTINLENDLNKAIQLLEQNGTIGVKNKLKEIQKKLQINQIDNNMMLKTKMDIYIEPYLNHIIERNGYLTNEDMIRFSKAFDKINEILDLKIEEIEENKKMLQDIEFNVIESEIQRELDSAKKL